MVTVASSLKSYSEIACEYYDQQRHPTCANFRECSSVILRTWLKTLLTPGSKVLETGAGASLAAELIDDLNLQALLILSDLSQAMLGQSRNHTSHFRLVSDAGRLSLRNGSVDAVMASLGDPYNTEMFWGECARVLRPGGRVFFTTPSFEWAHAFREETGAPPMAAEFETAQGGTLFVPSFVLSSAAQGNLVRSAGLQLEQETHVDASAIRYTSRSSKLRPGRIVSGYMARLSR